jgi:uncharacterized protein
MWEIEVAWAAPGEQVIIALRLPCGTTAQQAIDRSGILRRVPEIGAPDYVLHRHDRVEIYRPLLADPKEIRRSRASKPALKLK